MFRAIVIMLVLAMASADDLDCLEIVEAKLIGYKAILKDSLKVIQVKSQNDGEQEDNQQVETLINDRAGWADTIQSGIQTGSNIFQANSPLNVISQISNNGGMTIVQQAMGGWVNQTATVNELINNIQNTIVATGTSGIIGISGGTNRQIDSLSLKAIMTDISQTVNSFDRIVKVIDEIFN